MAKPTPVARPAEMTDTAVDGILSIFTEMMAYIPPCDDGYHVVGEGEVGSSVHHYLRLVVLVVERPRQIVDVAEDEELRCHHDEFHYRQLHHAGDIEEVEHEDVEHRRREVEHIGSPPYRQQHGTHAQHRHERHIDEVVEPCHVDVLAVAHGDDTEQTALLRVLHLLLVVYLV